MFNPMDFLSVGENLIAGAPKEGEYRTVIGRAYYSCFLVARDQLFGVDQRRLTPKLKRRLTRKGKLAGVHEVILIALASHPGLRPGQQMRLSSQLGQLKDMRVHADYMRHPGTTASALTKYGVRDWDGLAHFAMTLASNLIADLRKLPRFT